MNIPISKSSARVRRHRRIRSKVAGTAARPRLVVFRSAKHIYAQLVDDQARRTLLTVTDLPLAPKSGAKTARATAVGQTLAAKAKTKKITVVVFDRGGYRYHGRVKALADAARAAGLIF